jgi:hypothetical protein
MDKIKQLSTMLMLMLKDHCLIKAQKENHMKITIKFWIFCLSLVILAACGGGEDINSVNAETETEAEVDPDSDTNVSYLPLMTFESYAEWFNDTDSGIYRSFSRAPFISYTIINPVDATTLDPISTATADDFIISEDGLPINPKVSFPLLQGILGNQLYLRTAIVINTSSSMGGLDAVKDENRVDFIQGIKDYVAAAQSNSNYYMADQEFTVWGYSGVAIEETPRATSNNTDINNALDTVLAKWQSGAYESSGGNNTYDAIVEAIGRYIGPGQYSSSPVLEFRDTAEGTDRNDLTDLVTQDYILASNIILFSTGIGISNSFGPDYVSKALESQGTNVYQDNVTPNGSSTEFVLLKKPLIYVVPGDSARADENLVNLAHTTISALLSSDDEYSFSDSIIAAQIASLEAKNSLTNQHLLRWASAIRSGSGHTQVLETRSSDDQYGFKLSNGLDFTVTNSTPLPTPQVEITGANNEYIATNSFSIDYDAATTYANLINKFYPATRWTNQEFNAVTDYSWTVSPAGAVIIDEIDNSVTIATDAGYPITLTLTNNNIDHQGGTITDDFVLTILESN